MKLLVIAMLMAAGSSLSPWMNDFEAAKKIAQEKNQCMLINFSGSDWCGPCIRLHKEIFDGEAFLAMAKDQLVLVNADFPRLKKNQLPKTQQQQNEKLADMYNTAGNFPSTVLVNAAGKVLKVWDGYPKQGAAAFIEEINQAIHANNQ
jgi:thioredoxin-related protein